jgi:hypothetical protein
MSEEPEKVSIEMKGMGCRVSLSILVAVGWLVFLILWLFFYAGPYSWEKNLSVVLLSLLFLCGCIGIPWGVWTIRQRSVMETEMWNTKGFRWRVWVSLFFMIGSMVFLIYWFWFLAEPFNVYQNIAIFIVSFLIIGGLLGAMWAPWGMKHGQQYSRHHKDEEKK